LKIKIGTFHAWTIQRFMLAAMSEDDIRILSDEDHSLCLSTTNSCDRIPSRQSGADSDSNDTDVDSVTNKLSSTGRPTSLYHSDEQRMKYTCTSIAKMKK